MADLNAGVDPVRLYNDIRSKRNDLLAVGLAMVFDMDGVIIDSNPMHREAWRIYNLRFGVETTEAMHQRMYGKRNDEIVRDFFGAHLSEEEVFAHGAAKERLYREMIASSIEQALVPGIRGFLDQLRGSPLGVATNAEPANVEFILEASGLRRYFRVIVDGHQVRKPKPDPEIYLLASQRLQTSPPNCIVFEDSLLGIEAARAAGMRTVGVKTTHREFSAVDLAIDDFSSAELEPWLRLQKPVA
ncbi:MAG: beta-phosphoglucomutase family hydrolase [Acidobacteria bacterium]|nr:beta-phosphoglucomutase family hydrolase [Acidobacteriota bacterium]